MIKKERKRRISDGKYRKLKELYLLNISIRKAAEVVKVNRNTVEKYFKKFSPAAIEFVKSEFKEAGGEVEVDEFYCGGRRKGQRGRGAGAKIRVIGAIARRGKVYAKVVERTDADTLNSFISNTINIDSLVYTDGYTGYNFVTDIGYKHRVINHSQNFVKADNIHTNTIESFWAYAKKAFRLTHGGVKKYFARFLAKIILTFNHRSFTIQMRLLNKYLILAN